MNPLSPLSPLPAGVEMFQRGKNVPLFPPGTFTDLQRLSKAMSEATVMWEEGEESNSNEDLATEFDEDESSEFEEEYAYQFSSSNEGRRSQTTISTFEEVATPHSSRRSDFNISIGSIKSVEGPSGPHLFRSSTHSSEFDFDFALQLSPIVQGDKTPHRTASAQPLHTGSTIRGFPRNALAVIHQDSSDSSDDDEEPRSWSPGRVACWMSERGMDGETCDIFEAQDVTGAVLMAMNFDDLKEIGIHSFGKRHLLWHHVCELRGGSGRASPVPTPFQDTSSSEDSQRRSREHKCDAPGTSSSHRKRRGRKTRRDMNNPITPAESISIVAIEQLLPKPHKCAKGDRCSKWRKQQKLLKRIREEHGFPISPEKGGRIFFTGDPGNATTAPNMLGSHGGSNNDNGNDNGNGNGGDKNNERPTLLVVPGFAPSSENIPSMIASSDLLGPGEQPVFPPALQEQLLQYLPERDPQQNVKHFLTLQHMEPPQPVPITPIESPKLEMFPPLPTMLQQLNNGPAPLTGLQCLPRLSIPRSASAHPELNGPATAAGQSAMQRSGMPTSPMDTFSPCRSAMSPPPEQIYRFGTPASEMEAPLSAFPLGPETRDMSRSVPPNMQYRDPVARTASAMTFKRRGPSLALPTLGENVVFSPITGSPETTTVIDCDDGTASGSSSDSDSNKLSGETARSERTATASKPRSKHASASSSFAGVNHAGWMKKRRTRLLRHEWADHHFRLTGTQLAMHANSMPSSSPLETLNIDEYAVACSSLASGKLAARFKALSLGRGDKGLDPAAFSFQLVPAGKDGEERTKLIRAMAGGKTHYFAVRTRDERIDWMRELMLAKALKEKTGEGYNVKHMRDGRTP